MIKEITYLKCTCDRCGETKTFKNKNDIQNTMYDIDKNKWNSFDYLNDTVFCLECVQYYIDQYNALKVGDKVTCLIEDTSRGLYKGDIYTICDMSTGLSFYVGVNSGWKSQVNILQMQRI